MVETTLTDALHVMPNHNAPKPKHDLAKKLALGTVGVAAIAGVGVAVANNNEQTKTDDAPDKTTKKETVSEHKEDFLSNLKEEKEQVQKADDAVVKIVDNKNDISANRKDAPNYDEADKHFKEAQTAIAGIKGLTPEVKNLKQTYTSVLNVLQDPSYSNLQTARTNISHVQDSKIANHLTKDVQKPLISYVAQNLNQPTKEVESKTKPLTKAQTVAKNASEAASKKSAATKATSLQSAANQAANQAQSARTSNNQAAANQNQASQNYSHSQSSNNNSSYNAGISYGNSVDMSKVPQTTDNSAKEGVSIHFSDTQSYSDYHKSISDSVAASVAARDAGMQR